MKSEFSNPNDNWYYKDRYDMKSQRSILGCLYSLVGIIIIAILSLFFFSCKSIKYIPVETVKTEYVNKTDTFIQKDSIWCKDSVYIMKNGDTITIQKTKILYRDRWREKILTDSVLKVDSIYIPYPVEKKLTKWEKIKMDAGGMAIGACCFLLLILIVFLMRLLRKT